MFGLQLAYFLPWKTLFALSGPLGHGQRSENMFALWPPFLLGANGRKHNRERQKKFIFFLRLKVYKANKWM
jgi:hypothetical protein